MDNHAFKRKVNIHWHILDFLLVITPIYVTASRYSRQAAALVLVHGVKVGVQVNQRHGAASEVPGGAEDTPGQRVITPDTWRHKE